MIHDGFGDDLSVNEVLAAKDRLFQIMVSERSTDPNIRDDVLQEARIVAWKILASPRNFDNRDAYLHAAARMRISEVAERQAWTGHTRKTGQPVDPLRRADKVSYDQLAEAGVVLIAADVLYGVEVAYHYGQVHEAIRALPAQHRDFVYQKFWLGLTEPELAAAHDRSVATVSRWWVNEIRPVLRTRLLHMAGIVT